MQTRNNSAVARLEALEMHDRNTMKARRFTKAAFVIRQTLCPVNCQWVMNHGTATAATPKNSAR